MQRRPYQQSAIEASITSPLQRQLLVMSTGLGKTATGLMISRDMKARTLWLAHRDELVTQPLETLMRIDPACRAGVVKADRDEFTRDVVFASIQTVARPQRLDKLAREKWDLVVVDEAHHALSESYKSTLQALGCFRDDGPRLLGLTATPERSDNTGLDEVFQGIVFQMGVKTAIETGFLIAPRVVTRPIEIDLDQVSKSRGDFSVRELDLALLNAGIVREIVSAYEEHAIGRKSIIFTVSVDQAEKTAAALRDRGHNFAAVSGEMHRDSRRSVLRQLKSGELAGIVNCMVLTEGFDEPSVDCVVLARPTLSKSLTIQMVGRGLRLFPNKTDCLVLDLVGLSKRHTLIQAAVLFGDVQEEKEKRESGPREEGEPVDPEEYWRQRLLAQVKGVRGAPRSLLQWVAGDSGQWLLGAGDHGTVRMWPRMMQTSITDQPDPTQLYNLDVVNVRVGHHANIHLAQDVDIETAQAIAEDYVRRAGAVGTSLSSASWRERPATEAQAKLLGRLGVKDANRLTAGTASDLLTRLQEERSRKPATPKQINSLRRQGFTVADNLSQAEATRMFAKLRARR